MKRVIARLIMSNITTGSSTMSKPTFAPSKRVQKKSDEAPAAPAPTVVAAAPVAPAAPAASASKTVTPPSAAVNLLKRDPSDANKQYFDQTFGSGAAAKALAK